MNRNHPRPLFWKWPRRLDPRRCHVKKAGCLRKRLKRKPGAETLTQVSRTDWRRLGNLLRRRRLSPKPLLRVCWAVTKNRSAQSLLSSGGSEYELPGVISIGMLRNRAGSYRYLKRKTKLKRSRLLKSGNERS